MTLIQALLTPKWNWNLTNPVLILFFSKIPHFYITSHDCFRTINKPHDCNMVFSLTCEVDPQWECVMMRLGQVSDGLCLLYYKHGAYHLVCGCCSDRNYIIIEPFPIYDSIWCSGHCRILVCALEISCLKSCANVRSQFVRFSRIWKRWFFYAKNLMIIVKVDGCF